MKFIDLFAGIGGMRMGMERAGFECVFSSEINKHAIKTYAANFVGEIAGDITLIDSKDIPDHDILCGGFPCQPFSVAGKRAGFDDSRGNLFFEIMRIAKAKDTKILLLENVAGLLSQAKGKAIKSIVCELSKLGYFCQIRVINSKHWVPQDRKRVFILAGKEELGTLFSEFGTLLEDLRLPAPSMRLSDILEPGAVDEKYNLGQNIVDRIVVDPRGSHDEIELHRYGLIDGRMAQGYRVYYDTGLSATLSANGGGWGSKAGLYLIDGIIRRPTPRECARLMGFPDDFAIPVSEAQAYKQFGNSIVVPLVEAIAKQIKKRLAKN